MRRSEPSGSWRLTITPDDAGWRDVSINSEHGGVFAVPTARAERDLPFRYVPADAVSVELRGAGSCSRQVDNFCTPDTFEADRAERAPPR